jgi:hypothetical protein
VIIDLRSRAGKEQHDAAGTPKRFRNPVQQICCAMICHGYATKDRREYPLVETTSADC